MNNSLFTGRSLITRIRLRVRYWFMAMRLWVRGARWIDAKEDARVLVYHWDRKLK